MCTLNAAQCPTNEAEFLYILHVPWKAAVIVVRYPQQQPLYICVAQWLSVFVLNAFKRISFAMLAIILGCGYHIMSDPIILHDHPTIAKPVSLSEFQLNTRESKHNFVIW